MGAQQAHTRFHRPVQRLRGPAAQIVRVPAVAVLMHGGNGGQQARLLRRTALHGKGFIQMGMGFNQRRQHQRTIQRQIATDVAMWLETGAIGSEMQGCQRRLPFLHWPACG